MNTEQLLLILYARRKVFFWILGAFVLIALLATVLWPKSYLATVAVVINAKGTDALTGAIVPGDALPGFAATQIDIIASHNVAKKVAIAMKLDQDPEWKDGYASASDAGGPISDWIAEKLLKKIKINPSRESKLLEISFPAAEPKLAAELANAFAEAYIQTALEIKLDPARRQAEWFDIQLQKLRVSLEAAKEKLSEYQRENAIIGQDDRLDVENTRLAELSVQYVNLQAASYDAESRVHQLNEAVIHHRVEELADVLGNPLLQGMKAELARAEGKLALTANRYDRNHPEYANAAAEVDALRTKLLREIDTVKGSIVESARLAQKRQDEMKHAVEEQKQRILDMKRGRDAQDVLGREVLSAQQAYDAAVQRATQLGLESRLNESNIAVLNPAIPPMKAKWPKPILNLALSIVLGAMAGAIVILLQELRDRRVRARADLSESLQIPVLGEFALAK